MTTTCPNGHAQSDDAKFCMECGAAIAAAGASAKPSPTPGSNGCLWLAGGVVALFVVLAILGALNGDDGSSTSEDRRLGAFMVCQDFVKDRLRSPSSAKFRNYFQDDGEVLVTGTGDGPYTVRSTVDSQNGFGATLRSAFSCTVTNVGDDRWRLAELSLDD